MPGKPVVRQLRPRLAQRPGLQQPVQPVQQARRLVQQQQELQQPVRRQEQQLLLSCRKPTEQGQPAG